MLKYFLTYDCKEQNQEREIYGVTYFLGEIIFEWLVYDMILDFLSFN